MPNNTIDAVRRFLSRPALPASPPRVRLFSAGRVFLVALLLSAVGFFYVQTRRPGHRWAGDFALYVRHAQNIAHGRDYSDTRYIPNPFFPTYSPRAYPPVYPALLAAVYKFRGMSLESMKYVGIVSFLLTLLLLYVWLRRDVGFPAMLVLLATLGFHPVFWDFKDMLYADLPFLFFTALALFVWERVRALPRPGWKAAAAAGAVLYLACGTRSVGLVLVPAVVLGGLLRFRRFDGTTGRALAVLAALVALQGIFLYDDSGYVPLFSLDGGRTLGNARDYAHMLADLWENGSWDGLKRGLFLATAALAAAGYFLRVRLGPRELEVFVPLYSLAIVFWSANDGVRYIFPLVPFYFYYALVGLEGWVESISWRRVLLLGWIAAAALSFESVYARTSFGPFLQSVRSPESRAVFRFIRRNVREDAVLIVREPRVFGLYTGRRFSTYHRGSDEELWKYFHAVKAEYLVEGKMFTSDREFFGGFTARHRESLALVFENHDFKVHRILGFPL